MLAMEITRLIERCRQGDEDALGELYKAYAPRMKSVCRRYFPDEPTVEDVLHDAFIIILTSFYKLNDTEKAESWMMAIVRNVASKYKDRQKARPTVMLEETAEAETLVADDEQNVVRGVPLVEVMRLIDNLPDGYGKVFRLSVFKGMTHKEIAHSLGIEPHSSSSQLARAKKLLRSLMSKYWILLLALIANITFFMLKKDNPVLDEEKPGTERHDGEIRQPAVPEENEGPRVVRTPVQLAAFADDTLQTPANLNNDIDMPLETVNVLAATEEQEDTVQSVLRITDNPKDETAQLTFRYKDVKTTENKRWTVLLAYSGGFDNLDRLNQPYSIKPERNAMWQDPGGNSSTIPSSIENWSDYADYLANNPGAVSAQTRSSVMQIAIRNSSIPGSEEDRIRRDSHHSMPVTWSVSLKYRLDDRWGVETGLSYSCLKSDFEMGTGGNMINEHQTIHYIGVPVKGLYNLIEKKHWSLYGGLGLTTEIPVYSQIRSNYYLDGQYKASEETLISAPWQFSGTLSVGLQYKITPSIGLFTEPGMQYFIPTDSKVETYRTEHPFSLTLPVGLRFTW